jgi:CDP-diacylglycerol--serine O-phosphatidyltransferase
MIMVRKIAVVPTLFTLANGVCGFGAITYAARIPRGTESYDAEMVGWLWMSAWMILAAMIFDAFDGKLARLAKVSSDFGGQLDSICDTISFGVAPAFLLLKLTESDAFPVKPLWVIAVLYVMCVALRLARFNVENRPDEKHHESFRGLPSPAAAGAVASMAIVRHELLVHDSPLNRLLDQLRLDPVMIGHCVDIGLPLATLALAGLMVSRVPYPHVVNQFLSGRRSFSHLVRLVFAVMAVVLVQELALPLVFWGFALGAPLRRAWEMVRHPEAEDDAVSAEEPAV